MKSYVLKTGFAALAAVSLLSSCASNFSLSKRRYSNGYQMQLGWFGKEKQQPKTAATPKKALAAEQVEALSAQTQKQVPSHLLPERATSLHVRFAPKKQAAPVQALAAPSVKQNEVMQGVKPAATFSHAAKKQVQRALFQQQKMDDNTLLYLIIAFFIPFLGVLLYEREITNHFWISLLLTLLFWLPGFIYAALVILGEI